ncbi:MAG: esterase family protein [Anaerolineae bacterium]|nr:esterase family protein [Anaerolineae bacterium]
MTDWLARARAEGTPLIDGDTATFVWIGPSAPTLRSDVTGWSPMLPAWTMQAAGPGVWTYQATLSSDTYLEYAFFDGERRIPDPFNPRLTATGLEDYANHYVALPDAPRPLWHAVPGVRTGLMLETTLTTRALPEGQRIARLYRPPAPGPYPLLVVYDGNDYLSRAQLPIILDNLLAQRRIRPLAALLLNNYPPARVAEYACSEATLMTVVSDALPWAQAQAPLLDTPGAHGVMGTSMGGLMALFTGLRRPDLFGHVLAQSGAYGWRDESIVFDLARWGDPARPRIYQSVGRYEWLLGINRRLRAVLVERGYDSAYHEFSAGHNYPAWAADLTSGLAWLFPA